MPPRTREKKKSRTIPDGYFDDKGQCLHCKMLIRDMDRRTFDAQGHEDGKCLTTWKQQRLLERQRPSVGSQLKRARRSRENSVDSEEEDESSDGASPLPPEGPVAAAVAMDTEPVDEEGELEYSEGDSSEDEDFSVLPEDDDSGSEDDRPRDHVDHGGDILLAGIDTFDAAAAALQEEFLSVDRSRPPRCVEDYQARLNEPIYEGAEQTLVQWLIDSFELRGNTSRDAWKRTWKHHLQHYSQPNICPTSWYMCKRVLGVEHFDDHVHHFCPCDRFRYPKCEGSSQEDYKACSVQQCSECGAPRFKENENGQMVPQRWAFYIPLDVVIKRYYFANPNFTEAVGKGRPSVDPQTSAEDDEARATGSTAAPGSTFWGSPAFEAINDYFEENGPEKSRVLESRNSSPYSLFVDFFQPWKTKSYRTGAILLKCEDLSIEDRGRLEFSPVIMIIPGPKKPEFAAPYLELIAKDFEKFSLGEKGILIDEAVKRAEDGKLVRVDPFYHRPVLIGLDADTPAGQWVLEAVQSSTGYLICFKCKFCGEQNPQTQSGIVYLGYGKPCQAHRGMGKGQSFKMGTNDEARLLTPEEYEQRIQMAVDEENVEDVRAIHGIYDDCIFRKCLPYIDYRWFVRLPLSHCFLYGIVQKFWRLVLRWQGSSKPLAPENAISLSTADIRKLKKVMNSKSIKAHCDFNRPFGGLDTLGMWEMEDWMRWTEIYSTFVRKDIVGVELNEVGFQMWHHLRKAVMHYMYGTDAADYQQAVRDVARKNLLDFGVLAEKHLPKLCVSNLHRACCWLPIQEHWLGLVAFCNELWGERGLRPLKRASLNKVTVAPEKTQANVVLQKGCVNIMRATYGVEEKDGDEGVREDDVGAAFRTRSFNRAEKERENRKGNGDAYDDASGTIGLIGKGELLRGDSNNAEVRELYAIAVAGLKQLGLENDIDLSTLYCHSRAVLGVVECVHSARYKRAVSRDSTLVKIRYADESSRNVAGPWIAKVQFFLRCREIKDGKVIRLAICNFYKRSAGGELEVGVEGGRTAKAARKARGIGKVEHVWVADVGRNGEDNWNDVHYAEYLDKIDTKVISFVGENKSKIFFQKASFHSKV